MADKTPLDGGAPPAPDALHPDGPGKITASNFFAQQDQARAEGRVLSWNLKPEGDNYWQDPQRVVRYKVMLDAQPPDWQPPDWLNRDQINAAYDYLKFRNPDKGWRDWQPLAPDDPGTSFLRGLGKPPAEMQPSWDSTWVPPAERPPEAGKPFGDWENLKPWQQVYLGLTAPQPGMTNRPEWTRYTAALGQGVMAIPGGVGVGAMLGGPVGAAIGGGIALGGTAYQALTGQRIPVFSNLLDVFNILPQGAERVIGVAGQVQEEGWQKIMSDFPAAWEAANLNYETQKADLLNAIAVAAGDKPAQENQVWQLMKGYADPQQLAAGRFGVVRGEAALKEARTRISGGEDPLMVYQDMLDRFGDSGTFNDFLLQTLVDPTNLMAGVGGRVGAGLAELAGEKRLALALREGVGNPIVDALPLGLGEHLGKPFGLHGSEGIATSLTKYSDWIRRGYFPKEGPDPVAASQLSSFEKFVGKLTPEGKYKDLEPAAPRTGSVKDWISYLNDLTPSAKANTFLSLFHDNVNVLLDMANKEPAKMVELLDQAASANPADVGRLGEAILSSPATATISQALRDTLGEGWHKEMLLRWEEGAPKREILGKIAQALETTAADVIDRYTADPAKLAEEIKVKGGPAGDAETLKAAIGVFAGEDALPINEHQFQYQLALTVFDKLDGWLVKRYNLQPESAVLRASRVLKGMQSLLLLGFNPSYFINNVVNNMVTRQATGVFGYLSPRQVRAWLDRFGVTPERMSDAVSATGEGMDHPQLAQATRSNDWIGKAGAVVNATNQKLGVFSKFSSASEKIESTSATMLGMQKFWGKAWKPDKGYRRMHPTVEAYLDRVAPGVKDLIYQTVSAGMNMAEIEKKLFTQAIAPEVGAIIDQVSADMFPSSPDLGNELLRTHGIQGKLESYLAQGAGPAEAFQRVREDLGRVVNEAHKRDVAARPDDVANRVAAEGAAGAADALNQISTRADNRVTSDPAAFTRLDEYARATFGGILKGLDRKDPLTKPVTELSKAWSAYAKERRKAAATYEKAQVRGKDETFAAYTARTKAAKLEHDARQAELYTAYQAQTQAARQRVQAAADKQATGAGARAGAPTPGADAQASARTQALEQLARDYNLVDVNGNPVLRYLVNIYNRAVPKGERVSRPDDINIERAAQALEAHKAQYATQTADRQAALYQDVAKIIGESDATAREADLVSRGLTTRRLVREQFAEAFKASDTEIDAAMALIDAHADTVTRRAGVEPTDATRDGWYATHIAGALSDSTPDAIYNNIYQSAYGSLIATHNLTAEKLLAADQLGALPVPSIAVTRSDLPLDDFGDITLIGRRDLIDPKVDRRNRVFEADIFSARRPRRVYKKVPAKKVEPLVKRYHATESTLGDYFTSQLWDYMVSNPSRDHALELFNTRPTPKLEFLKEKGRPVDVAYIRNQSRNAISDEPAVRAWLQAHYDELKAATYARPEENTPAAIMEFSKVVRQAVNDTTPNPDARRVMWTKMANPTGELTIGWIDAIMGDYNMTKDPMRVDIWRTDENANKAIREGGLQREYATWSARQLDALFEPPKLQIGTRTVENTLPNIVAAMTRGEIRGAENTLAFGAGKARASVAKEFKSVDQMHAAEGSLVGHEDFRAAEGQQEKLLTAYQNELISYARYDGYEDKFDAAMQALVDYIKTGQASKNPGTQDRMQRALEKNGFSDLDESILESAMTAADALVNIPTEYFEAKPQRAVDFNEFAGAVIPEDAPQEVVDMLNRRGIEYRTYNPREATGASRQAALAEFYGHDNVLFQTSAVSRANMAAIKEIGFVPANAVKHIFEAVTDPAAGPAYTRALVRYILEKKARYDRGEMTVRDVAKAYLATVSSQGSDALKWKTVKKAFEAAGVEFVRDGQPIDIGLFTTMKNGEQWIRPEEMAGLWMWTDQGRQALDALEQNGVIDETLWKRYMIGHEVYGRFGRGTKMKKNPETGIKEPVEYPGEWFLRKGAMSGKNKNLADIQAITDEINAAKGDQARINKAIQSLGGVSEGKTGFVGHMLGFGGDTVVDTQQANFWRDKMEKSGQFTPDQLDTLNWGNWGKKGTINQLKDAIESVYWQLRAEGIGSEIPESAFVYTMHHWLWSTMKGAEGDAGTTHSGMYHVLQYGQESTGPTGTAAPERKGSVAFLEDGRALIRGLSGPDITTLVHEVGHIFRRDLDGADLEAVAQIGGLGSAAELKDLEGRFQRGEIMPGDPEYQRLVDAEEYFARGWERYLAEGDAPTPELKGVFSKFTDWMLAVYRRLRVGLDKTFRYREVSGFGQQADFIVGGKTVSLSQRVGNTTLKDVFDRLLTEQRHGDVDPYGPTESPAPAPSTPELEAGSPEHNVLNLPVRKLPEHVRTAIQTVAKELEAELAASRVMLLQHKEIDGGAEVTKYERKWEGPYWYRQILDEAIKAGQDTDKIKEQYLGQLRSIISGRDTGKAAIAGEVKNLILDRALGRDPNQANIQPALLRYLGMNDELFSMYGDHIMYSDQAALERMFGDEWSQVFDDNLVWQGEHPEASANPDATDIEGNPPAPITGQEAPAPVDTGAELFQTGKKKPAQAVPPVDLFGNSTEKPFTLEQQQAQDQTFKPAEQAQQGELFNRADLLKTIEGKTASDSAAPIGTDEQPSLFQNAGSVPPGGTPTVDPWGATLDESLVEQILPLLDGVETRYKEAASRKAFKLTGLDEKAQGEIRAWLKDVQGDMASTKFAAMGYGQQLRDAAMLNYNKRYGIDNIMELAVPYQFWYTRSMVEWAKRMIDRPGWFGMYARLLELQRRQQDNMPQRLRGKVRMPTPWLPDWTGGGLWFDPLGKLLPFSTFGQPVTRYADQVNQTQAAAERALTELVKNDQITQAEADQAKATHAGPAWTQAMGVASADEQQGTGPENLLGMMMTPSLWWTAGSNILSGHPERISPLPVTRTAQAIQAATKGGALEPLGKLAGLAAWPEQKLRGAAGLSEYGQWGDYYVDRQLANMAADGAVTPQQAQIAMVQKSGPVYDQAKQRVALEQAMTVPGAGALYTLGQGNIIGTLQALPQMIFGGTLFPTGELKLNGLAVDFKKAYQQYDAGDKTALDTFFKDHPEYQTRLALNTPPEERLKQFLISEVWDRYGNLEKPNRSLATRTLGSKFENAFLNKETRSYDSITPQELARWAQMLGGVAPDTPDTHDLATQPEPSMKLYPPALTPKIEAYQKERSDKFPNYYAIQSAYFDIPETDKTGRRRFLARFPQLKAYWDWKKQQQAAHPELAPYFDAGKQQAQGSTSAPAASPALSDKELSQVDAVLMRQVLTWKLTGQALTSGAAQELSRLGASRGLSATDYANLIAASMVGGGQ